jgi:hypothetical protein
MKYGDLSSIVQLGVGLHVGTAVLQLYGELAFVPLTRKISRIRSLFRIAEAERPPRELEEELDRLESDFELFKIQFFRRYRWCIGGNSIIALVLAAFLIIIATKAEDVIGRDYEWFAVVAIGLSFLPALLTLLILWIEAHRQVKGLKSVADDIETRALQASG